MNSAIPTIKSGVTIKHKIKVTVKYSAIILVFSSSLFPFNIVVLFGVLYKQS